MAVLRSNAVWHLEQELKSFSQSSQAYQEGLYCKWQCMLCTLITAIVSFMKTNFNVHIVNLLKIQKCKFCTNYYDLP